MKPRFPIPLLVPLLLSVALAADDDFSFDFITHGPMLGEVTDSTVKVWARSQRPGEYAVRYGTDPASLDQVSAPLKTTIEHDNTGWVTLTGLKPETTYHYQVYHDTLPTGPAGGFRTLPNAEEHREPEHNPRGLFNFSFQFGSCANQNPNHGIGPSLPTHATMRRTLPGKALFSIMNGDFIYEEHRTLPVTNWLSQVGLTPGESPEIVKLAPSVVGLWENYKTYLSRGVNLAAWQRNMPTVFTFDDHELVNDIRGAGTTGFRERRAVFRDIGIRAWEDYAGWACPRATSQGIHFGTAKLEEGSDILTDKDADFSKIDLAQAANLHVHWGTDSAGVDDIRLDAESPANPNAGVYDVLEVLDAHRLRVTPAAVADSTGSYSIGRRSHGKFTVSNCDFFLLDCKTHRQMHDPKEPGKKGLTLLGDRQKAWLLEEMEKSGADFFFVVSSVNFMIPHNGAGGHEFAEGKDEAWTSMLDERERLIDAFDALRKPVFILTADLHNSFAIKITDRVWEFASGPLNSVNHVPKNDEGDRPATGLFRSGPRTCDIRWSSYILPDLERLQRLYPYYCVAQINNVFNMPKELGGTRWVAYPNPQVIFQYFDGRTGAFQYAEAIGTERKP
ncbi:MAG: alkaline phosphatase D family protein [Verrucomicrobiae bacterium]|nr:alkaline phosphatase D family protein [Verrucomicrobiae bacterium]MCP5540569.1 alkaline phosphatase D family protein [Akkermansiaceae bacterium]MCP5550857.1 alkaline phosphatase D family protein [Akkermansiaceae bacterium]